jgi:Kef-type K+ transport system membrane component KefB/mannitol/fructose-specific phosphotransferase system IIA component (Ntr-type)
MHYLDESRIFLFLVQLLILMGCARGLGELFKRWNQPALTAEILVGLLLGPTVMGHFLPGLHLALFPPDAIQQSMLETIAWLGVLFLLLDTGLEIDFSIAWRQRGNAFLVAISDIAIPMVIAFAAVVFLPARYMVNPEQRMVFSLFMATVMTISAMPVAARVLHDLNLLKTDLGFLVMSALTVNDIIGWVLFTIILGVFTSGTVALGPIAFVFASTVGFAVLALTVGRGLSTELFNRLRDMHLPEPATSLTVTVLLGLLFGAFTQKLGIHALFGFFIAGVVVGEAKSLSEETRSIVSQMVHSLFVPLFFANIGLKLDFVAHFDFPLVALMCVVGIGGRYLGAWLGVTWSRVPRVNRDLIAIAHTPGGMMEIVVALLALEAGLITPQVFVAIVFSAVFSSVIMGPWMSSALRRQAAVTAAEFLEPESVIAKLAATTRVSAIEELAACVARGPNALDRTEIAGGAMAREREFGTAIGYGVAIPHVRLDGLKKPVLAFGRSPDGIAWDAPDGRPVHHVFFLATPGGTADLHVQILAAIARISQAPENRQRLADAQDSASLFAALKTLLVTEQRHGAPNKSDAGDGK